MAYAVTEGNRGIPIIFDTEDREARLPLSPMSTIKMARHLAEAMNMAAERERQQQPTRDAG